jgi:flagellar basal body rod protein FlgG
VIDGNLADALARVADRANDVLHAYAPGFVPRLHDAEGARQARLSDASALSTVAPEGALFVVAGPHGEARFTRDGAFRFERGALRTSDGKLVLGRPTGAHAGPLIPLRVDERDAALGRARDPRIDATGVLSCELASIDPRSGARHVERVAIGRVALARFPAASLLARADDGSVAAPPGSAPHLGAPGDGAFASLATHARELGRVDVEAGLARLQEAYLSLEAMQSAYRARMEAEKGATDLLK